MRHLRLGHKRHGGFCPASLGSLTLGEINCYVTRAFTKPHENSMCQRTAQPPPEASINLPCESTLGSRFPSSASLQMTEAPDNILTVMLTETSSQNHQIRCS